MKPQIIVKAVKRFSFMLVIFLSFSSLVAQEAAKQNNNFCYSLEIFPLVNEHTHGATIVELGNGDLLAAWFQGSGERWADDVRIMGARLHRGEDRWSRPFVMADVPDFPDINPVLFIDQKDRLWLVWYTVIANQWSTSLPRYRISENYMQQEGPPEWLWQDVILFKPGDKTERGIQPNDRFVKSVERQVNEYTNYLAQTTGSSVVQEVMLKKWRDELLSKARGEDMMRRGTLYRADGKSVHKKMGYPYFRRMGWQTKDKAVLLGKNRIVIPFYSDGFSFSIMAITDDGGATWQFSEPLVGPGNIQPSIAIKKDGTLVAYMRDNGPPPQRLMKSFSTDQGMTWSPVRDSQLPNPGSGADIVTLKNGHWVLAYNDTEDGRYSLAVSVSTDEGKTWPYTRHLELDKREKNIATQSAYPSIIQGRDGTLHVVYSFHHKDRKGSPNETIKYARFSEKWVMEKKE